MLYTMAISKKRLQEECNVTTPRLVWLNKTK